MPLTAQCAKLLVLALASGALLEAAPKDYAKIMQAAIRRSLGNDFREYEWMSYPTNNFGVATMYVLSKEKEKPGDGNQWCATYTCLGLEGKRAPTDAAARLTAGGFADVGTGGPLVLSDDQSRTLAGEVFLPRLLNILGVSIEGVSASSGQVSIRLGNVSRRILKKQAILTYLETLPASSPVRKGLAEHRLAMVVADAVIDSLEVDIETRGNGTADLAARLAPLVNRIAGGPSTMQVQVKRDQSGKYRLVVGEPVVIARLTLRRPLAGREVTPGERTPQLPSDLQEWNTWVPVGATQNAR
ncbi:MAG: hypothetical protein JWN34_4268 [Bryobacterales bacterium]|nr:hypothetical protein [Bryobacterales bacterium]